MSKIPAKFKWKFHFLKAQFWFLVHSFWLRILRFSLRIGSPERKIVAISSIEHLGDIVAGEPISRYIRNKYPGAYIIWCVRKPYRELIDSNPNIDRALVVYCLTEWIYLAKAGVFDEVIDLHFRGHECETCGIHLEKATGDTKIRFRNGLNSGDLLTIFCKCGGLPVLNEKSEIYISRRHIQTVTKLGLPHSYFVFNCSSNLQCKDWPDEKWTELVNKMISTWKVPVIEVGLTPRIKMAASTDYYDLCGKLSILQSAEVIRRAWLFIGIDSGPAHLANAVKTPSIILMGHIYDFKRYNPFNGQDENFELLYEDGPITNLSVERVYKAIADKYGKYTESIRKVEPLFV